MTLLRSCLLGQKEKMSAALQDHHVNDELPVAFYKWEYIQFTNQVIQKAWNNGGLLKRAENDWEKQGSKPRDYQRCSFTWCERSSPVGLKAKPLL